MMHRHGTETVRRQMVTAAFAVSWDGRVLERRFPKGPVDAVLFENEAEDRSAGGSAARVLVSATGHIRVRANLFRAGLFPVIVYSVFRMPQGIRAALAAMPHVRLHLRPHGEWPLREVLEHLRSKYKLRRVAFAGTPEMFRELAAAGMLDELCLVWRPCILGGKSAPPVTGLDEDFLPKGIVLDLLKMERTGAECIAKYRTRALSF